MADSVERRRVGVRPDPDLVEYLLVVVPDLGSLTSLTQALADLVDARTIRILDLVCVTRGGSDGRLTVVEFEDVESLAGLETIEGDVGGLLSDHDIETASLGLEPDSSAILLLVEDSWAERLSAAATRAGGRVVGGERIAPSRIRAALEGAYAEPRTRGRPEDDGG